MSVVDIEPGVRPETAGGVRFVFVGEAGALLVLLERSPEDRLVHSSSEMLLTPAPLCHKDTVQGTQSPSLCSVHAIHPYAIKTQQKARNAPM